MILTDNRAEARTGYVPDRGSSEDLQTRYNFGLISQAQKLISNSWWILFKRIHKLYRKERKKLNGSSSCKSIVLKSECLSVFYTFLYILLKNIVKISRKHYLVCFCNLWPTGLCINLSLEVTEKVVFQKLLLVVIIILITSLFLKVIKYVIYRVKSSLIFIPFTYNYVFILI